MHGMKEDGFEVLFAQGACLVVNKPPGVLTQAPPGIDSLEVRIKAYLRQRAKAGEEVYLGIPHRLDRPASGALVFGLDRRTTRRLARQFEGRRVSKTYWACVAGKVEPAQGTWTDRLRKIPNVPRAEVVAQEHPEGRQAVLHYRTVGSLPGGTWLEIELETGRMHQIRIQAASRGHPVVGDAEYGSAIPFGPPQADPRLRPIALHARTLAFYHPEAGQHVSIVAPLPEVWAALGIDS